MGDMSATMRNPRGTGTIERHKKNGRHRARIVLNGSKHTGAWRGEEADAQADLAILIDGLSGDAIPIEEETVGSYGARWVCARTTHDAKNQVGLWKNHIASSPLAAVPLRKLRRRDVSDWLVKLARKKKLVQTAEGRKPGRDLISVQTQRLTMAVLRGAMQAAVEDEILLSNPAAGHKIKSAPETGEEWGYLLESEVEILRACQEMPEPARLHFLWAISTGMREGEQWALRWADIDIEGRRCVVSRSYRKSTKANKIRPFPLLPMAYEAIVAWKKIAPKTGPGDLVWPSLRGEMRRKGDDYGWAPRSRGKQGVTPGLRELITDRHITYHMLRHTCGHGLGEGYRAFGIDRPWTTEAIQSFLGHGDIRTTQRYTHNADGSLADKMARETAGIQVSTRKLRIVK